jgi:hypothetical protein
MFLKSLGIAALCLPITSALGAPLEFGFDGTPQQPRGSSFLIAEYEEKGFLFKPLGPVDIVPPYRLGRNGGGISQSPENGTAFLQLGAGHSFEVSGLKRETFTAVSIDLAEYSSPFNTPQNIGFKGTKADGTSVTAQFTTDGLIDGTGPQSDFQRFQFPATFTNLARLEATTTGFSLDNLSVTDVTTPPPIQPQVLYDLDFNSPDHSLDQVVGVGVGPKRVSAVVFGTPTVRPASGALSSRPLEFDALSTHEQIRLTLPSPATRPPGYLIEFDVAATALRNSSYDFSMVLDTPAVRTLSLHGGLNSVSLFQPTPYTISEPASFADGVKHRFTVVVDLLSNPQWRVYMDSVQIYQNVLGTNAVESIRFSMSPWIGGATDAPNVKVALDNVKVTSGDFGSYAPSGASISSWRALHGLPTNGASDLANPGGDGVPNLLKFAFNMAPDPGDLSTQSTTRILAPAGLRGLPAITPTANSWSVDYLRRRSGLTYQPEMMTMTNGARWLPVNGTRRITVIDANWERVSEVIPRPTNATGALLRVRVNSSQ